MRSPLVSYFLDAVARYGVATDELLPVWRAQHPGAHEPTSDDFADLFRALATCRDDDALGLHVAEHLQFRAFSPVFYLVLSSASLSRSIGAAIRFADLMEGRASKLFTRTAAHGEVVGWKQLCTADEDRHHHEFVALAILKTFEWLSGKPVPLVGVQFMHERPGNLDEHERVFRCTPTFGAADHAGLLVPTEVWRGATAHADADTARMQETLLHRNLEELRASTLEQSVRAEVRRRLADEPTVQQVAKAVGMSARSLQRRLADLGTTYRQVVDDVRRTETLLLLDTTNASVDAIARCVGLADGRSLHRAFSRWTDTTPDAWRSATDRPRPQGTDDGS